MSQPISVVRADVGNQQAAKSLGDLADTLLAGSYKSLIQDAEQKGTEIAQSATSAQLRTINPETGMPEAFSVPPQFGRAASRAYQSMVERRYVKEIDTDLKTQSAKIFAETALQPDGFREYSERMRGYAADLTKDALPRFQNIVNGVGSSIIASTEAEFIKRKAARDLEQEAIALGEDAQSEAQTIAATIATIDLSNPTTFPEQLGVLRGSMQAQRQGVIAGALSKTAYEQNESVLIEGVTQGLRQNLARVIAQSKLSTEPIEARHLQLLENVIESGGVGVKDLPASLRPFVELTKNISIDVTDLNPDGEEVVTTRKFGHLVRDSFATELSELRGDYTRTEATEKLLADDQTRLDAYDSVLDLRDPLGGLNSVVSEATRIVADEGVDAGFSFIETKIKEVQSKANSLKTSDGMPAIAADTLNDIKSQMYKGFMKGVINDAYKAVIPTEINGQKTTRRMTPAESALFRDYIDDQEGGVSLEDLPPEVRRHAEIIASTSYTQRADVMRSLEAKNTNTQQLATAENKAYKDQRAVTMALNGGGENTKATREAADRLAYPMDINKPNFFLSGDGFALAQNPDFLESHSRAGFILSENLLRSAQAVANGSYLLSSDEIDNFFRIYGTLADRPTQSGDMINPFFSSMSAQEFAILDTVHHVVRDLEGSESAADVLATMRNRMGENNKEFDPIMKSVVGDTTGVNFVKEIVGENNRLAINYFAPLVPYMVAINPSTSAVTSQIESIYEREFRQTDGYVFDPMSGQTTGSEFVSRHALSKHIPSKIDRIGAVKNFNKYLNSVGVNYYIPRQEVLLREIPKMFSGASMDTIDFLDQMYGGLSDDDPKPAFLMPIPNQGTNTESTFYQLISFDKNGNMFNVPKPDGSGFVYVTADELRRSIAPPSVRPDTGNPLYDEYMRQQMVKQGTSNPILESDMSTISLDPYYTPSDFNAGSATPIDPDSFTFWLQRQFTDGS